MVTRGCAKRIFLCLLGLVFELVLQIEHAVGCAWLSKLAQPASLDAAQRHGVEHVEPFAAAPFDQHEVGVDEHLEVFHYREARRLELFAQFAGRVRALAQQVHQLAPRPVRQRLEDEVVVVRVRHVTKG